MQPRTRRQREVLDYIRSFIEDRGYEPSYQQIARHFHIASKSAIAKHVKALESQGMLSRHSENGNFSLNILPRNSVTESVCEISWLEIPFKENADQSVELESLFIPKFLIGYSSQENICAFRVRNNSMIEDRICEGSKP